MRSKSAEQNNCSNDSIYSCRSSGGAMTIKGIRHGGAPTLSSEMTISEFKRWLKRFDKDKDGRISKAELREIIRANGGWFCSWKAGRAVTSADADGDGFIDENEIRHLVEFAQKEFGVKITS